MGTILERDTPYADSFLWQLHDAYYQKKGANVWTDRDIPSTATSNYGFARQQAALLTAVVTGLEQAGRLSPDEPVVVLEVAGGSGVFAANLLRALEVDWGEAGVSLTRRLTYLLTDYNGVLGEPAGLSNAVQSGRLVLAQYDMRADGPPTDSAGRTIESPPLCVIANYACCVLPFIGLQIDQEERWYELVVSVAAREVDGDPEAVKASLLERADDSAVRRELEVRTRWVPVQPSRVLTPFHRDVVDGLREDLGAVTIIYPHQAIEWIQRVMSWCRPGGYLVVSDFGSSIREELSGILTFKPNVYGNSLSHPLNFALFDAFGQVSGRPIARTSNPLRAVHTAIIGKEDSPACEREVFSPIIDDNQDGEDLLDFSIAAKNLEEQGAVAQACRYYLRCHRLDPTDPTWFHKIGNGCLLQGYYRRAMDWLLRGLELDERQEHDFPLLLGMTHTALRDLEQAILWYERALAWTDRAEIHANLASVHQMRGDFRRAYDALARALASRPGDTLLQARLEALKEGWWSYGLRNSFSVGGESGLEGEGGDEGTA